MSATSSAVTFRMVPFSVVAFMLLQFSAASESQSGKSPLPWSIGKSGGQTGSYGGLGGTDFELDDGTSSYISRIMVRSGSVVDYILVEIASTTSRLAEEWGGQGGDVEGDFRFDFHGDEYVKSITFYKTLLNGVDIYLSGGFTIVTNIKTAHFGPRRGEAYVVNFDDASEAKLYGIVGRVGNWIDSVGFKFVF